MSRYQTIIKPARHNRAILAMQIGLPEGTLFVKGQPIAYYKASKDTVVISKYTYSGGVTTKRLRLQVDSGSLYDTYGSLSEFWYHEATSSLLLIGTYPEQYDEATLALRAKAARTAFAARKVRMPPEPQGLIGGHPNYRKRQTTALLAHMPEGFMLLEGQANCAYKPEQKDSGTGFILARATTNSLNMRRGDPAALKFESIQAYGHIFVKGLRYEVSVDGTQLLLSEMNPLVEGEALSRKQEAFALLTENMPDDAHIIESQLFWYRTLPKAYKVQTAVYYEIGAVVSNRLKTKLVRAAPGGEKVYIGSDYYARQPDGTLKIILGFVI